MATPILPFAVWPAGITQAATPANDNSLRHQVLNGLVISATTTAQPATPTEGDIYIIPAAATGTAWGTFAQYDLTIYSSGTWYAFEPVEGIVVNLAGVLTRWNGSAYVSAFASASLATPSLTGIQDAADDAAAAGLSIPVGGVYRTASVLKVRVA